MKRSFIAWAMLLLFTLGATPVFAAGAPAVRDAVTQPAQQTVAAEEEAGLPTITVQSAGGRVLTEDVQADAASGATEKPSDASGSGKENTPPVAENQELETYRGVSLGGQLTAHDAEGDGLTFEIVTDPMKGKVDLTANGYFVYTPAEGKKGKDYFGFRAIDSAGNVSQEGTVIIRLVKQKSKLTYSDMTGNGSEYAAIVLTENGVFTGESVGSAYVFRPDDTVTRGEFLSMCMAAADVDLLKGVSSTGFQDDGAIDGWLKPYVATALMNGYIRGEATATGASFQPEDAITWQDACVMLNSVLGVTDVVSAAAYESAGVTDAGAQAAANLAACGIIRGAREDMEMVLTRSGAADLLAAAIGFLAKR